MNQLQSFEKVVLEKHGAVVEIIDPEGLEVLAPPSVQQALRIPEWVRLGFGAELPPDAQRVSLDVELLERLGSLLDEHGRYTRLVLMPDNPAPGHPDRILEQTLALQNAVYRLRDVQPAWTRYLILRFRFSAISDEKHEGLLDFGYNTANGATVDGMLPELLNGVKAHLDRAGHADRLGFPLIGTGLSSDGAGFPLDGPGFEIPAPQSMRLSPESLERVLTPRLSLRLDAFIAGMRRRQDRDLKRVLAYHQDLQREVAVRLAALTARGEELTDKQQAEQTRERQRLEAIAREYQAKVNDVRRKYAMKVDLTWLQTLELMMPVQRFAVLIKRRKSERLVTLDWNPIARQLDQAPCEYSYTWERPRMVCDDALHLVSLAAHGPCPACGKAYCRACSPEKCPKCGRRATERPK
ncbi:MAG: hypothetical protein HYX78_00145 [Armatimonadetes bacterium]|nr:hypothetical protein [Armatimonadota bacterium]